MLGWPEILLILTLMLLVLGPSKLPEMAKALGQAMREFRKAAADIEKEAQGLEQDLASLNSPSDSTTTRALQARAFRTRTIDAASSSSDIQSLTISESTQELYVNKTLEVARMLGIETEGKSNDQLRSEIALKLAGNEEKIEEA